MWRFHAVRMQIISASPSPSSGTPPPPAKQQVSVASTSSDESFNVSTATMPVRKSIGARCCNSIIMRISGKPKVSVHGLGEDMCSFVFFRISSGSGEGNILSSCSRIAA